MGRYAQLGIGPAGSGKSTYCSQIYEYCTMSKRSIKVVNLDPAAEQFMYPVSSDVRELITLKDVMEELSLGPNGGLLYCMEYLEENIEDWLADELEGFLEDDYVIFDSPGEIELYSHVSVFRTLVQYLEKIGWYVCAVYTVDSHFVTDVAKFISGTLQTLSSMVLLEVTHINLLTKMDLCPLKENLSRFLYPVGKTLADELAYTTDSRYCEIHKAVGNLIDEFSIVSFIPLDISDEDSIANVLLQIDIAIQYGENEVKTMNT